MKFHYLPIYALSITLCVSFYLGYLPPIVSIIFIIASLLTYLIYAKDKRAAQKNEWRVSESTLHIYSLCFGWPGAIVAQQKLRHKSKKQSFRLTFLFTVLINIAFVVGMHTNEGSTLLKKYTSELKVYVTKSVNNQYVSKVVSFLLSTHNENYLYYESPTRYIREG